MACLCVPPRIARDFWYHEISIGGDGELLGYLRAIAPPPLPFPLLAIYSSLSLSGCLGGQLGIFDPYPDWHLGAWIFRLPHTGTGALACLKVGNQSHWWVVQL